MRLGNCLRVGSVVVVFAALAGCGSDNPPAAAPTPATYTVGGTVSGLSGSVTLANNGGDARTVTANGTFSFATSLASGAAYSVTITTQPSDQTCTVTSGSGTIASANVTTVSVTCVTNTPTPTPTYTIGGSVTGLQASGLVVQNNGGDNLPLSADGSFTFATAIASGSAYSVTVLTQPTNQLCTVANASGVVGSAVVTNVAVNCQPATIAPTFTQQPQSQSVVEPSPATFLATATGYPSPTLQWQVSTDSGATWTNISGAASTSYTTPATTVADDGKLFRLVATNSAGTTNSGAASLTVSAPTASKFWRAPVMISDSGTAYDVYGQQMAVNSRGDAIVAWERYSADGADIWVNRYVSGTGTGTGWQGATMIAAADEGDSLQNAQVVIDSDGNAVVVWELLNSQVTDGGRSDIEAAYYSTSSGWGAATLVETDDGDFWFPHSAWEPHVTMFDGGIALVVWNQWDGLHDTSRAVYSSTSSGTGWAVPQTIDSNNVGGIRVAGAPNGNATAAWVQLVGTQAQVRVARYGGSAWGAALLVDSATTGTASNPVVAQSANGDALVAWSGGLPARLMAARYTSGAWLADMPVSNSWDTVYAGNMKALLDDDGNGLVQFNGIYNGLSTAQFTATLSAGSWTNGLPVLFGSSGGSLDIGMNGEGETMYAYLDTSSPPKLRVSSDFAGGPNTTTVLASTYGVPHIEVAGNGTAIVIWIETTDGANRVWASEYR